MGKFVEVRIANIQDPGYVFMQAETEWQMGQLYAVIPAEKFADAVIAVHACVCGCMDLTYQAVWIPDCPDGCCCRYDVYCPVCLFRVTGDTQYFGKEFFDNLAYHRDVEALSFVRWNSAVSCASRNRGSWRNWKAQRIFVPTNWLCYPEKDCWYCGGNGFVGLYPQMVCPCAQLSGLLRETFLHAKDGAHA